MRRVFFFTGAGISADSGVSTFRDNEDGLWTRYNPDVVANMSTFNQHKELVFKFYNERRTALERTHPNAAHTGISSLQRLYGSDRILIFTQNIDDLFEQAGCTNVCHVHGELKKMRCLSDPLHVINVGYTAATVDERCDVCGGEMKPAVVFFGEHAPEYRTLYETLYDLSLDDLIVVVGTSGSVIPVSHITRTNGNLRGGKRVLCNKDDNDWIPYEDFDQLLLGRAVDRIDEIVAIVSNWMCGQ